MANFENNTGQPVIQSVERGEQCFYIWTIQYEIISRFFRFQDISISDILNFSLTCKTFNNKIKTDDSLWKCKFYQRWPGLKMICETKWPTELNIKEEVKRRINCRKKLVNYIESKHQIYWHMDDLGHGDLTDFDCMLDQDQGGHDMMYYYFEDELIQMIQKFEYWMENANLTHAYYAIKILPHIKGRRLKNEWEKYKKLDTDEQVLERLLPIIVCWCEVTHRAFFTDIKVALDAMAKKTLDCLEYLLEKSTFSKIKEELDLWSGNNIDDNKFNSDESRMILREIYRTVEHEYISSINRSNTIWPTLSNSIPREISHGIIVYKSVIFHAVARRLGVRCDVMCLPPEFCLIWKEEYNENGKHFYTINMLAEVFELKIQPLPAIIYERKYSLEEFAACKFTYEKLMLKLSKYFSYYWQAYRTFRSILEFQYMVNPQSVPTILSLHVYYSDRNMYRTDMIAIFNEALKDKDLSLWADVQQQNSMKAMLQEMKLFYSAKISPAPKKRLNCIPGMTAAKYTIGMVVSFLAITDIMLGVIIGWDFIYNEFVNLFRSGHSQLMIIEDEDMVHESRPYYIIFTDILEYYVPERLVYSQINEETFINNIDIGRYFTYCRVNYYVPAKHLQDEYPDDRRD